MERGEVRWERMFPDELEAAFKACPVAYLTYGLCEPHGPQNVVGLDSLKAHGIACRAARDYGGIVAPPDYWHVHEVGGYATWAHDKVGEVERKWLTAVPPWIHFKNVCYQIRGVDEIGFHAAVLITGHYGPNWKDLKTLVSLIQPHVSVRLYALPDFEANHRGFTGDGSNGGDHAGRVETSLLWAVHPECVDVSRFPDPEDAGPHFAMGRDAREASRRVGERMVEDEVEWLGAKADELAAEFEPGDRHLRRFEDVERFWREEIQPVLTDFESMQQSWSDREDVPRRSVWYPNWKVADDR